MNNIEENNPPHDSLVDGELKAHQAQFPESNGKESGKHVPPIQDRANLLHNSVQHDVMRDREGVIQRNSKRLARLFPDDFLSPIDSSYQQILALGGVTLLAAGVLSVRPLGNAELMPQFVGLALILFAMPKLFDLGAFKANFAEYDLITMRWPGYGYWYPLFELFLGLGFLSGLWIAVFSFLTVTMMSITAVGTLLALIHGNKVGSVVGRERVIRPLASANLFESIGMSLIALILFARAI
jgi:hypothetical protein